MKYLRQFSIIMIIAFIAEIIKNFLPLPIPASIYGLLLLFAALCGQIIKVSQIKETAYFLIDIMPIMFIPAAVGVMKHYRILEGMYLQSALIIFSTTIFVMAITGVSVQFIIRRKKRSN